MELPENLTEQETRELLLKTVKKEVKQIMEEAVTRKFVHEESSSVVSLCGAVECCLQHGLKKRALGLFKNSTTMALLQKVAKNFQPAAQLVKTLNDLEKSQENSSASQTSSSTSSSSSHHYHHLAKKSCSKYLWIRIALYEKQLARIVDHLVVNNSKYYEKDALLSDPVSGAIFASLLVGPCALEFTQMKTVDHLWTDPPAKELMQRHRIHSTAGHNLPGTHSDSPKRLALQVHKTSSSTSEDCQRNIPFLAKEYVESLHQNSKSTLLYGKNNVVIQPKEDVESMAGYLSLHQSLQHHLVVKWTPNQLMNVSSEQTNENSPCDRSHYWNYALAINFDDIVYLHCHHQLESGGTVVLVGQDGVQRPPIHFPKGGHLWAFLSCIEAGLAPNGHLEPPLSSHHEAEAATLKKKIGGASNMLSSFLGSMTDELTSAFNQSQPSTPPMPNSPKNHHHHPLNLTSIKSFTSTNNSSSSGCFQNGVSDIAGKEDVTDYVFRVVTTCKTPGSVSDAIPEQEEKSNREDSTSSVSNDDGINDVSYHHLSLSGHRSAVRQLCDTMSSQILSRAFYGWLSHCRQLKTVRTHLSGLVHTTPMLPDPGAREGLTKEGWVEIKKDGSIKDEMLLYRLIYHGGCEQDLRKEVWPFLLGHYKMESTEKERMEMNEEIKKEYERKVAEWSQAEDLIKSQEKDKTLSTVTTANSLNNSSSSSNLINNAGIVSCQKSSQIVPVTNNNNNNKEGSTSFIRKDSSLSNEVFESVEELPVVASMTTATDSIAEDCVNANGDHPDRVVVATVNNAATNPDDVVNDAEPTNASTTSSVSTTQQHSSSSSTSSVLSSSSAASNSMQQRPHQLTHHGHAKRMLEKSNKVNSKAKFTISDDGTSLDSSDSMKLDSGWFTEVDSDNAVTTTINNNADENHLNEISYPAQLLENLSLNIHRIDKDVHRCDRNHVYFALQVNLNKLRNIMCTYVWNNMDMGYVQGMCDLAAPLLVILDDEALVYSCFNQFMKRMSANFPNGNAMDQHFGNMRSLIQIMDPELFEHMKQYGDYTHFYFCYRWFLLDFKRELVYGDVFRVWETIWCARHVCSSHFVLFIALALLEYYREIIIDNKMDFTEIIKFFNELAERHNANEILKIARSLVGRLQELIENK